MLRSQTLASGWIAKYETSVEKGDDPVYLAQAAALRLLEVQATEDKLPRADWLARCKNDTHVAKELSPAEARAVQFWVRPLEGFREDRKQNEGWTISKDEFSLTKPINSQTDAIQSSTDPETQILLQDKLENMLHIQSEARKLVMTYIANRGLYGFDQQAHGRAALRLLLKILTLENGLTKLGLCVVSDTTRDSLLGIATFDGDAKSLWERALWHDWFLEYAVWIHTEEF